MAKSKLTRANYDAIRDHLFDRIHKNGEQLKNDFPNILRKAIEAEVWSHFFDTEGKPFDNLVDWLHYTFPNGTSMGQGQHSITYEEAVELTKGATDVNTVLLKNAPKSKPGQKAKNKAGKLNPATDLVIKRSRGGTTGLSARLAMEQPKFYDAYLRGDYKTITAAATAAGILKDDLNLRRAKSAFRMMTPAQRDEFLTWMATEAKAQTNNNGTEK